MFCESELYGLLEGKLMLVSGTAGGSIWSFKKYSIEEEVELEGMTW